MPKTYLTIESGYRPNWRGAVEGIREIMQNAIDAERQYGARMTVDHYDGRCLRIENDGATLDREALLLGHSSKRGRADLIGQFGDGLKIGVLALVRDGFKVKIRNGSEVWVASIERHDTFGADVLCFDISTGRKEDNRVRVEIDGVSAEQWAEVRERFLCLDRTKRETVKTDCGTLLLDTAMQGRVFVKGIFVEFLENLKYGYDLLDVNLDVDRRMVDSYDRDYAIRRVWNKAIAARPDLFNRFATMLDEQSGDVDGIARYNAYDISSDVRDKLAQGFAARYGSDAILVSSLSESMEAAHLGKRGVVAPKALACLLDGRIQSFDTAREALKKQTQALYTWDDLTGEEQTNLSRAAMLVSLVRPTVTFESIDVVDFRDGAIQGLCNGERIEIARSALATRANALSTLVHESAHKLTENAPDGDKRHIAEIEAIWSDITERVTGS